MKLVLDTCIYCDFAEGIKASVDIIAKNSQNIYMPSIVLGELNYGFLKGKRNNFNSNKLNEIIKSLNISIINIDHNIAKKYGLIYLSLVKKGKKIPINDVWISACCMEVGGTVLTRDKHYRYVDQIEVIILN